MIPSQQWVARLFAVGARTAPRREDSRIPGAVSDEIPGDATRRRWVLGLMRGLPGSRVGRLFAVISVLGAVSAAAPSAASASEITWSVICPAASYCSYPVAHEYYEMRACPTASFSVSVYDYLVDESWGKGQSGASLTPCVGLQETNTPSFQFDPVIYNPDTSNSRAFNVYLYYP